jgi:hypothetical protein
VDSVGDELSEFPVTESSVAFKSSAATPEELGFSSAPHTMPGSITSASVNTPNVIPRRLLAALKFSLHLDDARGDISTVGNRDIVDAQGCTARR